MKIEMGESLFYSWLRHVKECQIVQTNWKTSSQWSLLHEDELEHIMTETDKFFSEKYGYNIYKGNTSLSQLLRQAECDALGISIQDGKNSIYAVDVAFHEGGLLYKSYESTVAKIVEKSLRSAMCILGYLDSKEAEITFASPRVSPGIIKAAVPALADAQKVTRDLGYDFRFRMIANEDFNSKVLQPILKVSGGVSDTNELFMRSYQMLSIFDSGAKGAASVSTAGNDELKIGKLVQLVMRPLLEKGVSEEELKLLQDKEYCNKALGISFPLLVQKDAEYDKVRYYATPLSVNGNEYVLCSQWSESSVNNDRPLVEKWIREHEPLTPRTSNVLQ